MRHVQTRKYTFATAHTKGDIYKHATAMTGSEQRAATTKGPRKRVNALCQQFVTGRDEVRNKALGAGVE
eukprot:1891661-Pleurochrysis_carterae.AAC.5